MRSLVSVQAHGHRYGAWDAGGDQDIAEYQSSSYSPKDALGHSSCHDTLHDLVQLDCVSGIRGWLHTGAGRASGLQDARLGEIPEEPALCECDTSCPVLKPASCRPCLATTSLLVASKKIRRLLHVCSEHTHHPCRRPLGSRVSLLQPVLLLFPRSSPATTIFSKVYSVGVSRVREGGQILRRGVGMRADHHKLAVG